MEPASERRAPLAGHAQSAESADGLTNVFVLPYAASDKAGSGPLGLEADPSRSALVAHGTSPRTVEGELHTIDEVLEHRTQALRLLKADAEGHEAEVFRGAMATLTDNNPILLFEDLFPSDAERGDSPRAEF